MADRWSRACARAGPVAQLTPSNTNTLLLSLPAASRPPITYRRLPRAAAAPSSRAAGRGGSRRWEACGDGLGEGATAAVRDGVGGPEPIPAAPQAGSTAAVASTARGRGLQRH